MRKLFLVAVLALVMLLGLHPPLGGGSSAEASHVDPVLFVHGFTGNSSAFNTMASRFAADGWESGTLWGVNYNSYASNATTAQTIKNAVDYVKAQTGASKVDIIAHSMGSLNSRYYLKNLGGQSSVDDWVSLGGPNHGTVWAFGCAFLTPCQQMTPGSSFLNALNSGDETPGAVTYGTWWSPCDELITPDESVILSGAANAQTSCISHGSLLTNSTVYGQVRDFVR